MLFLNALPQRLDSGATPTFAGILAGDGTAAAPSMSFLSAPTLGVYRYSSSALGFAVSGAQSIVVGGGGQIFGPGLSALLTLGSSGSIAVTAGGTNQNITLTPSGTGIVLGNTFQASATSGFDHNVSAGDALLIQNTPIITRLGTTITILGSAFWQSLVLKTGNVAALTLDASQNATFAGRARTADGTLASPGHSFGNDSASGMYRAATNTLGFSSGGTLSLTLGGFGEVVCGASALGTTTTDGFFYFRSMAGVPTGVPTAYTGRVAATYDSTNNKLYIYNGAWKSIVLV
jgi:hypothetical protein